MARDPIAAAAAALVTIIRDVATDPRKLKPAELCRILNSTAAGQVLDDGRMRRHRMRAGTRIGDGKTIDLLRYAGWLGGELHFPTVSAETVRASRSSVESYEAKKERENERNKEKSKSGREIGSLPPVKDPARRAAAEENLRLWCDTYLAHWFSFGWSPDLEDIARDLQTVLESGGQLPSCMPRGGGKSTIGKAGVLFGILKGAIKFGVLIGAIKKLGVGLLADVKTQLLTNDKLLEDYPEVCVAVRKVGNIANRCNGLTYNDEPTGMEWGKDRIILPRIPGSKASGTILAASGLDGAIRGLNVDGARPDFAFLDDPQTKKSARNPDRVKERLELIEADVRGLAGPGNVMKIYAAMTVIYPGDVADRLLDPEQYPDWQGKRYKLLYAFPKNMELWREYRRLQEQRFLANSKDDREAKFYLKNRKAMDLGAHVAWEDRKPGCASALQFALNLFFQNEEVFYAEYQNQPQRQDGSDIEELQAKLLRFRTSGLPRGVIPNGATTFVAHVDVMHSILYWGALACDRRLSGELVDHGTWPDQNRTYYQKRSASPKLADLYKNAVPKAAVKAGLIDLLRHLLGRTSENWPKSWPKPRLWKRQDGVARNFELILVDWSDGAMQAVVAEVCLLPEFVGLVCPAAGRGIGPDKAPMDKFPEKQGELIGDHWLIGPNKKLSIQSVTIDTNYWKSDTADALMAVPGNPGSLVFHGKPGTDQRLLADHCTSEYRTRLKGVASGRVVDVWKENPGSPDNDHWDNIVGCRVAASIRGCSVGEKTHAPRSPKKKRRKGSVSSLKI
ncbi:MAG: phage terminase large subunit family protein [Planctomycetia bacterium]|nr:phage terminase large subunit family protein [Planctomycetia bacterium]